MSRRSSPFAPSGKKPGTSWRKLRSTWLIQADFALVVAQVVIARDEVEELLLLRGRGLRRERDVARIRDVDEVAAVGIAVHVVAEHPAVRVAGLAVVETGHRGRVVTEELVLPG